MSRFPADLRFAIRILYRSPKFTLATVAVLALGIGSNSALFTAIDQTVIRPLPYADSSRLAMLWEDFSAYGTPKNRVSPATFLDWRKRTQSFAEIAAYAGPRTLDLSGGGTPEEVLGPSVTANLIPMLGVSPLLGRSFTASEESPDTHAVILSYRLWQRRFAGDPNLIGNAILMNGEKYTVLGVMPRGFSYPDRETELWLPLGLSPQLLARRNSHFLKVVGRLKSGRTIGQAQSDMRAVARQLAAEFPASNSKVGITVVPFKDELLGDSRSAFVILLAAAGCVLLIACANVGNLMLARASTRHREIAVRLAIGAAPSQVRRQVFTESLLLGTLGGAFGLLLAFWSLKFLQSMIPASLAGSIALHLDLRVLAFTAAVSLLTSLLFGFGPALRLSRIQLAVRGSVTPDGRWFRDFLVMGEIAAALVLVVGAALLIQTLIHLRAVDPGFHSQNILTANISVPLAKYSDAGKRHRFYNEVLQRVRSLPGVKSAGLTSDLPYTSRGNTMGIAIEGRLSPPGLGEDALFRLVSAGYLETIGARLVAGRFLDERDREDAPSAVVINEAFARQYFPHQNPLGRRINSGTGDGQVRWMTVAGVVADIRERGLDLGAKPAVYVPFPQTEIAFFLPSEIAVHTTRDPLPFSKELQQSVWAVDSAQPVSGIRTMDQIVDDELANRAQVLDLLAVFAALSLLLAAMGIYSVLSYITARRTREIGLRMAVGATRWNIVQSMLGYTARLTLGGLTVGIAAALAATRLLSTLLFGVSPLDWRTFLAVAAFMGLVALAASTLPTLKASSIDPAIALREE